MFQNDVLLKALTRSCILGYTYLKTFATKSIILLARDIHTQFQVYSVTLLEF
jgi:hypothetical protein